MKLIIEGDLTLTELRQVFLLLIDLGKDNPDRQLQIMGESNDLDEKAAAVMLEELGLGPVFTFKRKEG